MRLVGDIALDAEVRAIASSAITDGSTVVVNADGTVSSVSSSPDSLGDQTAIYTGDYQMSAAVYDTGQDKVLFIFNGASQYGRAIVGTVSGNSISFGTSTVFISSNISYVTATYDPDQGKTAIFFNDNGDSNKQKAVVATVSGTSVSFGTVATLSSAASNIPAKDSTYDTSENKILVSYSKGTFPAARTTEILAATISGTDISFGSETEVLSTTASDIALQYDANANKSLIIYVNANNSNKIDSRVVSLSGTTVSLGSETNLYNAAGDRTALAYDSTNNKIVAAYRHDSSLFFAVATISGTSVSYGTEVTTGVNFGQSLVNHNFSYNVSANKVLFSGRDDGNSYIQKYVSARVSGTSITMDTPVTYYSETGDSYEACNVYDPDQEKSILFYADGTAGAFKNPVARVLTLGAGDNLTSENFIGFAHAAYADGQKATVKTTGSIARNIPQLEAASSSLGSEAVYASVTALYPNATFDSSNNRVVIGYTDGSNSNYGTAVVGSVSGTSISFGTPVVFESASIGDVFYAPDLTFDSNSNKVVLVYPDGGNSNYPTAIVGTVDPSDNSISFGTAATIQTSGAASVDMSIAFDSNSNKVLAIYSDAGNSNYTTGAVGTVSGTNISFGTKAVVVSDAGGYSSVAFDSNSNKFAVFYTVSSNGHGKSKVATISGTDVTYGSEATFASASSKYPHSTFDSSNNKIVLAFEDDDNSDYATAIVGTISGTDITFGTEAVINQGPIQNIFHHNITFATGINKVIHFTRDGIDGDHGKVHIGTVSGTGISFGSTILINGGDALTGVAATFDSNSKKAVLAFTDEGNSNYGTAVVLTPAGTLEDLTIGQQYFVQTDGTLDTSADDPSVIAGTAIGTSDIIVKG